jgi:DNA primase
MKIPDGKIQEIRDAVNILDVVSQYVSLKARGKSHVGLCPFHQEKTPSFTVDPVRGFYHCFGCGAGGDVFSFVMRMEKVGFLEAVKSLADRARIALPTREQESENRETEQLYAANRVAAGFYRTCLRETVEGKRALDYITRRGFSTETLETFQIGYSPQAWDGLIRNAGLQGLGPEILFHAGLAVPRRDGTGYYDRFRGRLMFPVFNLSGRVVGFGARILESAEGVPKYINTAETPIYRKGSILYGLYQSKTGIRRENRVLLVEGYTDMMRLFQGGYDHAVASSGTALTEGQARILSQYAQQVVLVFDGDSAGFRAALRGIDIVLAAGLHVEVAALPKGMDPDAFLLRQGPAAFARILQSKYTFVDFQLGQIRQNQSLRTSRDKVNAAKHLLATASKIREPMERQLVIKDIAEKLGIEETLLFQEMKRSFQQEKTANASAASATVKVSGWRDKAERGILAFLFSRNDAKTDLVYQILQPEFFAGPENRKLFHALLTGHSTGEETGMQGIFDRFRDEPETLSFISRIMADNVLQEPEMDKFIYDSVQRMVLDSHRQLIESIRNRIKTDPSANQEYLKAKKTLENVKVEIDSAWKKIVDI